MGRQSRKRHERRSERLKGDSDLSLHKLHTSNKQRTHKQDLEGLFYSRSEETRSLLSQYHPLDAAIALCVSELWPANAGSPIKHIFAWGILLGMSCEREGLKRIESYADFKVFAEKLYKAWPEFPMLEDFSPESDWGQVKIRLKRDFVPIFYGGCIERTPDFIEAFRITYAHKPEALAHLDLAIALQSRIIEAMPDLRLTSTEESRPAHVELPPQAFWLACRLTLIQVGAAIGDWRDSAGGALETEFGAFQAPLTLSAFGDAAMRGSALPFMAITKGESWLPMSVRSVIGVVVDHWASKDYSKVSDHTHRGLAKFVAERFRYTIIGPVKLFLGNSEWEELPISCIASSDSVVYLICACDRKSSERVSKAAEGVYDRIRGGEAVHFRLANGRDLLLSKDGLTGPNAEELRILVVVMLGGTAFDSIDLPDPPSRLLPLADFVTIFDSLGDLDELESYWTFVDSQGDSLGLSITGPADLYASFKDSHGVLIEGAIKPSFISLDPHWGTSWRFKTLANFWSYAPPIFPDGSSGWRLTKGAKGVVELQSRHHKALAYSTSVGCCTIQSLVEASESLRIEDARMLDLFAQLLADCTYRSREQMLDVPLFRQSHVLFICEIDPSGSVGRDDAPKQIEAFKKVVTFAQEDIAREGLFHLQVDAQAVMAGLNDAIDGSFEVRCLLETLEECHNACGLKYPIGLEKRLRERMSEPARYQLKILDRSVDIPDYVEPIIPSLAHYKLARKHLAAEIMALGLTPGRYELDEAKARINPASSRLHHHIESRLALLDRNKLLKALIEQNDALLFTERTKIQRAKQSLTHDVDYDRLEVVEKAREEYGITARHYRYLLEKTVSLPATGSREVADETLRELGGLVDWYMALTGASDLLHNGIDVGGVVIDDFYIPDVFFSSTFDSREEEFAREYAKSRLGLGSISEDTVEGDPNILLSSKELKSAFKIDLGFDLQSLIATLTILSQAQRYGFADELSLSYIANPDHITQVLASSIEGLDLAEAGNIVAFLTLSEAGVRRLSGRDADEADVPYWEHNKRIHRYSIRPLVIDGANLRWGAEAASRAMNIWMSAVRDGYLPADFSWPHVDPVIREIKESIEKRLEQRTEEIFLRYTPFVVRGIDFYRRFRGEMFDDVGDFDVFAYWPDSNLLVTVECKYNRPPYTLKDGRRLRDRMFGNAEDDKAGQFSRIRRRRQFIQKNRPRLLELLNWPISLTTPIWDKELYVSRDIYYWMINPPYAVPTMFVRVDGLDTWIRSELYD
jgi:hypothetical protein